MLKWRKQNSEGTFLFLRNEMWHIEISKFFHGSNIIRLTCFETAKACQTKIKNIYIIVNISNPAIRKNKFIRNWTLFLKIQLIYKCVYYIHNTHGVLCMYNKIMFRVKEKKRKNEEGHWRGNSILGNKVGHRKKSLIDLFVGSLKPYSSSWSKFIFENFGLDLIYNYFFFGGGT